MKLRYTPEARADLRGITLHYREINVDLAKRVLRLIRARCHRLSRFPYVRKDWIRRGPAICAAPSLTPT